MLLLKFFLAVFLFFQGVSAQCGPPQCYTGCTDARPLVDFVFLIDVSGSMQPKINGVKNGLTIFANSLDGNKINPQFSIVTFGAYGNYGKPILEQQLTDFDRFKKTMDSLSATGGMEPGLEALSVSMNAAKVNNLNIAFRSSQNSKKVFILVTNEDSDQAYASANTFSTSQARAEYDGACYNSNINQATWDGGWQNEINYIVGKLIEYDASLYMFVGWTKSLDSDDIDDDQTCKTPFQYCNPERQSQGTDYKNFNAAATLSNIRGQNPSQGNSLQGKMLAAGKTSRCFDVADTSNPTLVNNFFDEIVTDIKQCDRCYAYNCSGSSCLPPVYVCDCAGTPYGPMVRDSAGNCCLSSQKDCAGICNGPSRYDACGVCTPNGALHPACELSCDQTRYLNLPPNPTRYSTYSGLIYITTPCPDSAGYLIPNTDLINHYKSTRNPASICAHYHTYGRFESRVQCVMDTARYASEYAVAEASAKDDYLTRLLTTTPRTAYCQAGSRFKLPPTLDACEQCVTNLDTPPYCVRDCQGEWKKAGQPAAFIDNCGYCVSAGSDPNARKDFCKVCDGGNATLNECGECNGVKGQDACGQNRCRNLTCSIECDNVSRPTPVMQLDECGYCVPISSVRNPQCVRDCAQTWFKNETATSSPHIRDECGNCVIRSAVRLESCKQDCSGKWNGTAFIDQCSQCVVDNTPAYPCKQDCQGFYYREGAEPANYTIDDCGNCRTNATRNDDKDGCGVCRNKAGYNSTAQCTQDCKDIYRLIDSPDRAFTDSCGSCWFANETSMTNYLMDDCGYCRSSRTDPLWNSTTSGVDSQGQPCLCRQTPVPCANASITTCRDNCPEFNFCPNSTIVPDQCGRCPGNPDYNLPKDDCGVCCYPSIGVPCNQDKDSCGVCFGFDKDKNNPCGICLNKPGNTCVQDCLGVYGGNATYGCDGICNSKATCSFCGNGIIEPGESCDKGPDQNVEGSGCSPACVAEAGNSTGSIVGGIIGGIAAIAFLALAAFAAVKYAQRAGLIGSANKQIDMGASNSNPLYKEQVAVHQNPLYKN